MHSGLTSTQPDKTSIPAIKRSLKVLPQSRDEGPPAEGSPAQGPPAEGPIAVAG